MSEIQRTTILNPTSEDYTTGAIIRDMCGEGAKQKLAKRKLDGVGEVHSACGVARASSSQRARPRAGLRQRAQVRTRSRSRSTPPAAPLVSV